MNHSLLARTRARLACVRKALAHRGLRASVLLAAAIACVLVGGLPLSASAQLLTGPPGEEEPKAEEVLTEGLIVHSIELEGLYRVSPESVMRQIRQRTKSPLRGDVITNDIKRIYKLGFFEDVRVAQREVTSAEGVDGVRLLYQVVERPTVDQIRLRGNDELDAEDINKVLDIRRFSILSIPQIERNASKIRELYVEKGYYLADVDYLVERRPNNLVDVIFVIDEGAEVKVQTITILGNKKLDDDTLKGSIFTREEGVLSFLDQSGTFNPEAFRQDLRILQQTYLNEGYVTVSFDEPVVTLAPDKEHMHITLRVTEGEQYNVGAVDVMGDFIVPKEELMELLSLEPGEVFSQRTVIEDNLALSAKYKDAGYANVSISSQNRTNKEDLTVDFTYMVSKGDKVYFRFIEVQGNKSTRDKVVRREMLISEGDLYNQTNLDQSKNEIMRLGFFEDAKVTTRSTDDPSLVDVVVQVKERDTGTFQIGAGFSSIDSFLLTAQIAKQNLFGRGQSLSFNATLSPVRTIFSVSFFEPYFLDSRFTFGFDLFNVSNDLNGFTRDSIGGELTFGYRFTRDFWTSATYRFEQVDAAIGGQRNPTRIQLANLFRNGRTSSLRGSLIYDRRNNRLFPTGGFYLQGSVEWASAALGSENEFVRLRGNGRLYVPLFWGLVYRLNGNIGYVISTNDREVPIFERFFVGGIFTVRGYLRNSLGPEIRVARRLDPTATTTDFNVGGNSQLYFNNEIELPILEQLGIRAVGFLDFGQAYDRDEHMDPRDFRYAAGFGIRWWSPVGPLRFEWGFPLDRRAGEDPVVFEFTIGNAF